MDSLLADWVMHLVPAKIVVGLAQQNCSSFQVSIHNLRLLKVLVRSTLSFQPHLELAANLGKNCSGRRNQSSRFVATEALRTGCLRTQNLQVEHPSSSCWPLEASSRKVIAYWELRLQERQVLGNRRKLSLNCPASLLRLLRCTIRRTGWRC